MFTSSVCSSKDGTCLAVVAPERLAGIRLLGKIWAKDMTGHILRTLTQAKVPCHCTGEAQHRRAQVLPWDDMVFCSGSLCMLATELHPGDGSMTGF